METKEQRRAALAARRERLSAREREEAEGDVTLVACTLLMVTVSVVAEAVKNALLL